MNKTVISFYDSCLLVNSSKGILRDDKSLVARGKPEYFVRLGFSHYYVQKGLRNLLGKDKKQMTDAATCVLKDENKQWDYD